MTKKEIVRKTKITQIRSAIGRPEIHKRTLKALGLKKMGQSVVHMNTPQVQGMIKAISHLIKVEEVKD